MKILLTGKHGQLGNALIKYYEKHLSNENIQLLSLSREEFDLINLNCFESIIQSFKPDWIINTAAFTNVDKAEDKKIIASKVNTIAPIKMAKLLKEFNGMLLQISSDYVFSGKQNYPYQTFQKLDPINFYGKSKADAEKGLKDILDKNCIILRTSWVYGSIGNNFVLKMIELHKEYAAKSKKLNVVVDQIGVPTNVNDLAKCCWKIINLNNKNLKNIYHWCDAGVTSWYDFALAIGEISQSLGIIKERANVMPIKSIDFQTKAKRPFYSVLDNFSTLEALKINNHHWRERLSDIILEIRDLKQN